MVWVGIGSLVVGALWTAFKGYIVWDVAHDCRNGSGVPTLDFVVLCPIPLAMGLGFVAPHHFTCAGQIGVYVGLAVLYGLILWLFDRMGAPARARQLADLQRETERPSAES